MFVPFRRSFDRMLRPFATQSLSSRRSQRRAALRRRPRLEDLEGRQMLTTIIVNTTQDNGNNANPTNGSLRAAIMMIDQPGSTNNTIEFKIPSSYAQSNGLFEIQLDQNPLPQITNPVDIDGLSQNVYVGNSSTTPLIQIDGSSINASSAGTSDVGLDIAEGASGTESDPTQVSGLDITDFAAGGVFVNVASYVQLSDLSVGVFEPPNAATGTPPVAAGNGSYGVYFYGRSSADEGSYDTLSNSVVSANQGPGVQFSYASDDMLNGDFIGTDVTGELPMASNGQSLGNNGADVLFVQTSSLNGVYNSDNTVENTVIANSFLGVELSGPYTEDNTISNDFIGTNVKGTSALPNTYGVFITNGAYDNTIGGTPSGSIPSDVISGNYVDGVDIVNSANNNTVEGDYIGVISDPDGSTADLGNGQSGVAIYGGAYSNTIGVTASGSGAGNVISGNGSNGVYISDSGTYGNLVAGDDIGTNAAGTGDVLNSDGVVTQNYGVLIQNGASYNTIGSIPTQSGIPSDVISGNAVDGVHIINSANNNTVEGDYIGVVVDPAGGTADLGNGQSGVAIYGGAYSNTIGVTASGSGAGNVISGNGSNGVYISDSGTYGNLVAGDDIGTNIAGTGDVLNSDGVVTQNYGVLIQNGAYGNTIGGVTGTPSDVISGNAVDGVHIVNSANNNTVEGDYIGVVVDPDGGTAALENGASGVAIYGGAFNNTIGVTASGSGAGNVISGNGSNGVYISDSGTYGNLVAGDDIGTNAAGTGALPNIYGVVITNGAYDNTIGGTPSDGIPSDVISGNYDDGVHIVYGANNNTVEGDYIGVIAGTAGGTADLGNGASGVAIYGGAYSNTIGVNASGSGSGNVISGNGSNGVYISDSGTYGNLVAGDDIGTNAAGSAAVLNSDGVVTQNYGVLIQNGAYNNTIGGVTGTPSDVISGNFQDGVHIVNGAYENTVEGDYIGVNAAGNASVANGESGVAIYGGAYNNIIGGNVSGSRNVISGNGADGVYINDGGTNANVVEGDYIGTDYTGWNPVPNNVGVYIGGGATNNIIGGTSGAATRDVISGNTTDGVQLFSVGTAGNMVEGDFIGTNVSDIGKLSNGQGVEIYGGANNNTIGVAASGSGSEDVIEYNTGAGVYISDSGTVGNVVAGDAIAFNTRDGIQITSGACDNVIGGSNSSAADWIWSNGGNGVELDSSNTSGNTIENDFIETNGSNQVFFNGATYNSLIGCTIQFVSGSQNAVVDNGTGNSISSTNTIQSVS